MGLCCCLLCHQLLYLGDSISKFSPIWPSHWSNMIIKSYGVYLTYYLSHGSFAGARPLDYAFIGGSNFAAAMLCAPLATVLARRYGSRPPMLCGICIMAGGLAAASFATATWHLYLTQGALVGLGTGLVYIPSMAILSQWFLKRRSLYVYYRTFSPSYPSLET